SELVKSIGDILANPLVFGAGLDQAVAVAPLDAQAYRANRVIVGNREGAAAAPITPACVPAKEQAMLQTGRKRFFDEILQPPGQNHLEDSPRVHFRFARFISDTCPVSMPMLGRHTAVAQQVKDLREIPGSVKDRTHAVSRE